MATQTEIDSMYVRLTGDGSSYQQMLSQAQQSTIQAAQAIQTATSTIEGFKGALEGFAAGVAVALGAGGMLGVLKQALGEFQQAEGIAFKLNAALEANGRQVDAVRQDYEAFAAQMEKSTTAEDDSVLATLSMAESYDLTGEAAKRATKNAIALAAAKGGEASSYIRLTSALEKGNSEMLGRMLPALRLNKDPTERAAKAQELLGKMFKQA